MKDQRLDALIKLMLALADASMGYREPNDGGGYPIQTPRNDDYWSGVAGTKLAHTKKWWDKLYRVRWSFFDHAIKTFQVTECTGRIVERPKFTFGTPLMPSQYEELLKQLDVKAVLLSRDLRASYRVDGLLVFSDEDATLLSAHFSTEEDLKRP